MVRIGFIGLGAMGGRMTTQLLDAGYDVTVFDPRDEAVEAIAKKGATPADSAVGLASATEIIMLSLPGPNEVLSVTEEISEGLESGNILIDLTTSTPHTTDSVSDRLTQDPVAVLGAPVSGGTSGAETGTLSVMVGGEKDIFEQCKDIFETIGSNIFYIDEQAGHGHAMKLVNNYLSFVAMVCTSEALVIGEEVGLEKEAMLDVINTSSGRNTASSFKFPEYILPETYDMEYTMGLVEKGMQLLMDVSSETKTPFMAGGTIRQIIGYIRGELGEDADYTEIYKYFDDVMGDAER